MRRIKCCSQYLTKLDANNIANSLWSSNKYRALTYKDEVAKNIKIKYGTLYWVLEKV